MALHGVVADVIDAEVDAMGGVADAMTAVEVAALPGVEVDVAGEEPPQAVTETASPARTIRIQWLRRTAICLALQVSG